MRAKTLSVCLFVSVCVLGGVAAADKVTSDPNAPGAAKPAPIEKPDERLKHKVTCEIGYTRLHALAEQLTKLTGVTIRAGTNLQDWQVRDLPLVVCVRDMELGDLLKAVADCEHVTLSLEKSEKENDPPSYRLVRRRADLEDLAAGMDPAMKANLKIADWAWDRLVAYAGESPADGDARTKLIAKLLAALGPEGKQRALAGERIIVGTTGAGAAAAARQLYDFCAATERPGTVYQPIKPTEEDGKAACVEIVMRRHSGPEDGSFELRVNGIRYRSTDPQYSSDGISVGENTLQMARSIAIARNEAIPIITCGGKDCSGWQLTTFKPSKEHPEPPHTPGPGTAPADAEQPMGDGFTLVGRGSQDLPLLQQKMTLKRPDKPVKDISYADAMVAAAKTANVNIIAEDFLSHRTAETSDAVDLFGTEMKLVQFIDRSPNFRNAWFLDESNKLLVGTEKDWRVHHRALVQEKMLNEVVAKSEGSGAELDDVTPLLGLTAEQVNEWITPIKPLQFIGLPSYSRRELWVLYSLLTPDQKALARSPSGLALRELDQQWLGTVMKQAISAADMGAVADPMSSAPSDVAAFESSRRVLTDPAVAGGSVLRIVSRPDSRNPKLHSYSAELTYSDQDRNPALLQQKWDSVRFPYRNTD